MMHTNDIRPGLASFLASTISFGAVVFHIACFHATCCSKHTIAERIFDL
jgi:hypothetical protein